MQTRFSLNEMSLEAARAKRDSFTRTMAPGSPLRFRPVVVIGPTEKYLVIELGIAERERMEIVK